MIDRRTRREVRAEVVTALRRLVSKMSDHIDQEVESLLERRVCSAVPLAILADEEAVMEDIEEREGERDD
jgi:hypothetical protein